MSKKRRSMAAGVALIFLSTIDPPRLAQAVENPIDLGSTLYSICTLQDGQSSALCSAYIGGVRDGMIAAGVLDHNKTTCFPEAGGTIQQEILFFELYAKTHPEELSRPAGASVAESLHDAFPCPKEAP